MKNFGTSYYLKLLGLNPKPRETELIRRLFPSDDASGYDFHKRMREIAAARIEGDYSKGTIDERLATITQKAERESAVHAIRQLDEWLGGRRAVQATIAPLKAISPANRFSVVFKPDIAALVEDEWVNIHLWNTMRPKIGIREAAGCIGLFREQIDQKTLAVLNLRNKELYRFATDERTDELARILIGDLERRLDKILEEPGKGRGSKDQSKTPTPPDA